MIPTPTRQINSMAARARSPRRAWFPLLLSSICILGALSWSSPARAQESWLMSVPTGLEPGIRWPMYVPEVLLVKFKSQVNNDGRRAAVASEGASYEGDLTNDGLVKVRLSPGQSVPAVLDHWNARNDVEYAAPDIYARGFFTPNDTTIAHFDLAWNLRQVHAYDAWDVVTGDPDVVVAIIDSGIAFEDH